MKLQVCCKGKMSQATVSRDGIVRYDGKPCTSPFLVSLAARKYRTCNGWTFWQYERAPGDWAPLDELRR